MQKSQSSVPLLGAYRSTRRIGYCLPGRGAGWKPALRNDSRPRPIWQTSSRRIFFDVVKNFQQRSFVANPMIEILTLPEISSPLQKAIRHKGREGFPGVKNSIQFVFTKRGKYNVHVIRHHAPRKEIVALTVKMLNRIRHNFGDTRIAHVAFAETAIETAFRYSKHAARIPSTSATSVFFRRRDHLLRGFALPTKLQH